jgi:hypothetical protein
MEQGPVPLRVITRRGFLGRGGVGHLKRLVMSFEVGNKYDRGDDDKETIIAGHSAYMAVKRCPGGVQTYPHERSAPL